MFFLVCRKHLVTILFSFVLAACVAPDPTLRMKASSIVSDLEKMQAPRWFPDEYHNLMETFEHGEAIIHVTRDQKEADYLFSFVLQKGMILKTAILKEERRKAAEKLKLDAEEAARKAEEILLQQAREAEERLHQQETIQIEEEKREQKKSLNLQDNLRRPQPPLSYTVRRGETLPQIAARAEIYNDSTLWPLIYRANRDQVRDPKRLWPGQVLSIPRLASGKK